MIGWGEYDARMGVIGEHKRDMWVNHTKASILRRAKDSLSYHTVLINGVEQNVTVTHRPDMYEKRICAMPDEKLAHGGIVDFADTKWLITDVDFDNEIYQRGLMRQCNYQLKWIGKDGTLKEKWCVVEDGTKYLIGEKELQLMTVGDARIAVTVGKDEDTVELSRGMRFIIDDSDTDNVLVYEITKPNRLFNSFEGHGVFRFILTEVNLTDADNIKERIADYSDWTPEKATDGDHRDSDETIAEIVEAAKEKANEPPNDDKEVWL